MKNLRVLMFWWNTKLRGNSCMLVCSPEESFGVNENDFKFDVSERKPALHMNWFKANTGTNSSWNETYSVCSDLSLNQIQSKIQVHLTSITESWHFSQGTYIAVNAASKLSTFYHLVSESSRMRQNKKPT